MGLVGAFQPKILTLAPGIQRRFGLGLVRVRHCGRFFLGHCQLMKLPISWRAAGSESADDDLIALSTVNGQRLGICMSTPLETSLRPGKARTDISTWESAKRELLFGMVISCTALNKVPM